MVFRSLYPDVAWLSKEKIVKYFVENITVMNINKNTFGLGKQKEWNLYLNSINNYLLLISDSIVLIWQSCYLQQHLYEITWGSIYTPQY